MLASAGDASFADPAVDQENTNEQDGYAGAYAEGDEVHVLNYGDITAGSDGDDTTSGDGINAESTAFAKAEVDQEVDQDNSNSQDARWETIRT